MKPKLIRLILLALNACDGLPMPEAALVSAVQIARRPVSPTAGDVLDALKDTEAEGYVSGLSDDVLGRSWTLTEKGAHKARQLR
jgi:hypothetical protein